MNDPLKDPDQTVTGEGESSYSFADLTETCAIKINSLLRICSPVHWPVFQRAMFDAAYRGRTGLAGIISYTELEVTDIPVAMPREMTCDVKVKLDIGRSAGDDPRIITRSTTDIFCTPSTGRFDRLDKEAQKVRSGTMIVDHILTRPSAPPEQRRVRELPPDLGFTKTMPGKILPFVQSSDVLRPPEPYSSKAGSYADNRARFWSYNRTDPNDHVHAMEYVRAAEDLATDALGSMGDNPANWYFQRIAILYKRPMFTGNAHVRVCDIWKAPGGEPGRSAVTLQIFPLREAADPGSYDPAKPCVCVRLVTAPRTRHLPPVPS